MKLKLLPKTLLIILPALFLIQLCITLYVDFNVRTDMVAEAEGKFTLAARQASVEIVKKLDSAYAFTQVLAKMFEGMDRSAPGSRGNASKMLHSFMEDTPGLLCSWVVFEPNKFDGRDSEFINRDGYSEKGRFQLTFVRSGGLIILS